MTRDSEEHQAREIAWRPGNLRATAFLRAGIERQNWWEEFFGGPPEARSEQPQVGTLIEAGHTELGLVTLTVRATRVDWVVAAESEDGAGDDVFPVLGPMAEMFERFRGFVLGWLEADTCPEISRLAFSSDLLHAVESKEAGYQLLIPYLPCLQLDPAGTSDFTYQINRRRESRTELEGLEVNRLSRWLVATKGLQHAQLDVAAGAVSLFTGQPAFACNLYLDISTVAEAADIVASSHYQDIFEELVELGSEIAEQGDIP